MSEAVDPNVDFCQVLAVHATLGTSSSGYLEAGLHDGLAAAAEEPVEDAA